MKLSELSVKRPVTIAMVTLIVILLGIVSLTRLPIDLLPKIEVPVAIVSTNYDGAGPVEIENMITRPIEQSLATVSNIENLSSTSSEGNSVVIVQFNFGTDMNFATLEMREKIDMVKGFLPDDASAPMVLKIDPNAMPIMQISLSQGEDLAGLQNLAEDIIKPRLERLEGVASVDISGGYEKSIEIDLYSERLHGYGLSIDYIAQIIGAENLNLPGGEVKKGNQGLTIRTVGEFENLDEIKNLPIPLQTGGVIKLSDVGNVELKYNNTSTVSRTNGSNSINISIQKQSGTNTVNVAKTINTELENLRTDYPNISIDTVMDQSEYINKSIENVAKNALLGGLLAIIILFIFLKNFRTTIIIGTAIPVSVIATFILIYFNDITLNLMTLGGLALGVGMLVDNAIVVLENIYRFRQEGYSRIDAAINGAKEVGMAVTASTLTTIAVFLPIVFVEGITSTIFKELALTVTMSLVASLGVSLTLIPMLSSKFLKVAKVEKKSIFDRIFGRVESIYKGMLKWSLRHRKSTILLAVLVFLGSMASIFNVGAEFFPTMDEGQLTINVSLPLGAELEDTNEIISNIEDKISNIKEIDIVVSNVGSGGQMSFGGGSSSNRGSITATLVDLNSRERSTSEVADEIRGMVKDIPGAKIGVEAASSSMMGMGGGTPLSVSIKGDEIETLKKIGEDIKSVIESVEGTREVKTGMSEGIPQLEIKIDRIKASTYGLTAAQIGSSVRNISSGRTATRYKLDGDEIDVVIKGDESYTESISNLEQIPISTAMGITVPLSEVADVSIVRGPVSINREDQVRVTTVSSQIIGRDIRSITEDVQAKLADYDIPAGYSYEFTGENEQLNEAFGDLSLALILAVVLVYMILASQFESLLHPFTIMLSVPLAFAGAALGLFTTRHSLSVPALIGFIILAGIVVNNAIVLVDYINTRRKSGEERNEAILNAGPIRLRPILMTTLTTVLGLFPLALGLGEGAEVQAPLAVSVIGGLLLSTILTLVFVPVIYTITDDSAEFIKKKILKRT